MMDNRVEKFFTATDGDNDSSSQYGPFRTSGDAETAARQMGWGWVCVHTTTVHSDVVIDMKQRFYQLPDEVDSLRRKIVRGKEALGRMTDDTRTFFEKYEEQMSHPERDDEDTDLDAKAARRATDARLQCQLRRSS